MPSRHGGDAKCSPRAQASLFVESARPREKEPSEKARERDHSANSFHGQCELRQPEVSVGVSLLVVIVLLISNVEMCSVAKNELGVASITAKSASSKYFKIGNISFIEPSNVDRILLLTMPLALAQNHVQGWGGRVVQEWGVMVPGWIAYSSDIVP